MHNSFQQDMIGYTLSKSVFGSELKPSDIQELAQVCTLRCLPTDAYLFHQGDPATGFFIVHTGAVKVHRVLADGREQVIHVFRQWESFAEVALSGTLVYPVSASAVEPSQVISVESEKLRALIHRIPDISLRIIASMSLHLKFLVGKLERQRFQSADSRLAEWILEQCVPGAEDGFELRSKKKNIAAQLGVTSETFSRVLLQFKKAGWLSEQDKYWTILNRVELQRCAEQIPSD
jgi:CRP/FNR family transcriptional regulator, dissimilatory nitrate respiration regulator